MSADGTPEQNDIEARLSTLCGGRVYADGLPEETQLARYEDSQLVKPYLVLTFGGIVPQANDRSIEGAADQPQIMPIIVECWAADYASARASAGAVRTRLLGYTPNTGGNASEIDLRGGTPFPSLGGAGRPSRYMESVTAVCTINNSIPVP